MSGFDLQALGLRAYTNNQSSAGAGKQSLGQEDFLTLLITQLKNQDPLNPMDNETFVAQLAQFSTVSGITELGSKLERLEAHAAQETRTNAVNWLGRTVRTADGITGIINSLILQPDGRLQLTLDNAIVIDSGNVSHLA